MEASNRFSDVHGVFMNRTGSLPEQKFHPLAEGT